MVELKSGNPAIDRDFEQGGSLDGAAGQGESHGKSERFHEELQLILGVVQLMISVGYSRECGLAWRGGVDHGATRMAEARFLGHHARRAPILLKTSQKWRFQ